MSAVLEESRLCSVAIENWEHLIQTILETRTPPTHPGPVIAELRWRNETFIGSIYYEDQPPTITVGKGCYLVNSDRRLRAAISLLTSANHDSFVIRYNAPLGQLEEDRSYCIIWEFCEKRRKKPRLH